jgi:trk system potassium uptake protein TrkA
MQMHVVIAGCGRVGSALAGNLDRLGHSVAVVDKNPKAFEKMHPSFSGKQIVGFVFDQGALEEAQIKDATAFAAVTSGDNSNIVSARVAKEHYRIGKVVARIYDPRRAQVYQRLGIETVATVRWTTDQALRSLLPEEAPVEHTFDNGEVVVMALPAPPGVIGQPALSLEAEGVRRVVAVSRFGVPRVPDPEFTLQEGDILHIATNRNVASELIRDLEGARLEE